MSEAQREHLEAVRELLVEVMGPDEAPDVPITLETSFNADLELESIEFVVLAELLADRYGADVDFVQWISQKELDDIIALTVGDLVDFLCEHA